MSRGKKAQLRGRVQPATLKLSFQSDCYCVQRNRTVWAIRFRAKCAMVVLCTLLSTVSANAQVVLHDFTGFPNDGSGAAASLVPFGSAFYGMTNTGGSVGF